MTPTRELVTGGLGEYGDVRFANTCKNGELTGPQDSPEEQGKVQESEAINMIEYVRSMMLSCPSGVTNCNDHGPSTLFIVGFALFLLFVGIVLYFTRSNK